MLRKNIAGQSVFFVLVRTSNGQPVTGATVTVLRALDAAAQVAATGTVTELGGGQYRFDPSQADTNGDFVGYLFSAATALTVGANFITTVNNPHDAATAGITNLDAAVSSRMATYVQPTGFLAAVFPSDPADQSLIIAATDAIMAAVATVPDAVWDEPVAGHTTIGTFGQGAFQVRSGTAQGGAFNNIQLDAGASALNDFYNNQLLVITGGLGVNQARYIADYDGATRNASVNFNWDVIPDATSQFVIIPGGIVGVPVPTVGDVATGVWDYLVDPPRSAGEAMRLQNAAMGGKASGLGTNTATYRDLSDTKDRIVAIVDEFGNRTAVTLDLT